MAAGVACGLQNRRGARKAPWVGSTPTRSRHLLLLGMALLMVHSFGQAARGQEPVGQDSVMPAEALPGQASVPPPPDSVQAEYRMSRQPCAIPSDLPSRRWGPSSEVWSFRGGARPP